jgi:hypothetical protein
MTQINAAPMNVSSAPTASVANVATSAATAIGPRKDSPGVNNSPIASNAAAIAQSAKRGSRGSSRAS